MLEVSIHEVSEAEHPGVAAFYEKCGYSGRLSLDDKVLIAMRNGSLVGAVRLCSEEQDVVLRGLHVVPDMQRQGIGLALLQACVSRINGVVCYCIPWAYLEQFYASGGFERCKSGEVPGFLSKRFSKYLEAGRDVIVMRRTPTD